jgi:Tol biopolymer transport system component
VFSIVIGQSTPTQLTHTPGAKDDPAWAPHDEVIAFWSAESGRSQLVLLRADQPGAPWKRLTSGNAGAVDPVWSPDGKRIAYTRNAGPGQSDIWVVNADGTGNRAVTSGPARDMDPSWSADGAWIAFTRGPLNGPAIHIVRADGSGLRRVTIGTAREGHASWS